MKKLIQKYREFPVSTRFWNNLIILFAVILPFIDLSLAAGAAGFASFIFMGLILDGKEDDGYWWIITPLFWIFCFFFALFEIGSWINKKTVKPFNSWLNEKFK